MRVMVLVKATKDSEAGIMPSTELLEAMGKFNEELVNAGIMRAGDGLKPSSQGKRVAFDGPNRTVIDGPFAKTGELVAGYWLWEVKDIAEAVEVSELHDRTSEKLASRCNPVGCCRIKGRGGTNDHDAKHSNGRDSFHE